MSTIMNDVVLAGVIREVFDNAARFREVHATLNPYLEKRHGCLIGITRDGSAVMDMRPGTKGKILFRSHSYTACLEYALALPIIESE